MLINQPPFAFLTKLTFSYFNGLKFKNEECIILNSIITFFCFSQYKNKYYTKKQKVKGFKQFIDSVNLVLMAEIKSFKNNNDTFLYGYF